VFLFLNTSGPVQTSTVRDMLTRVRAVVGVGRLEASVGCAVDLKLLILLGDMLDVPVRYDFETHPQVAYLEVVSAKRLREAL